MRRGWSWLVVAGICGAAVCGCTSSSGSRPSLPSELPSTSRQVPTSIQVPTSRQAPTSLQPSTTASDATTVQVTIPTTVPATTAPTTPATSATTAAPITAAPTTAASSTTSPTTTTSTTTAATTTTLATSATSSSHSVPWGWVIALLVVAALAALIALLVHRNTRAKAIEAWQADSRPALDSAHLTLSLLPASGQDIADRAQWNSVRQRVEEAAQLLDRAAARAPTQEGVRAASRSAETLRGLGFALESNVLLREASVAPTAQQLADADVTTRQRRLDAEAALAEMDRLVGRTPAATPA